MSKRVLNNLTEEVRRKKEIEIERKMTLIFSLADIQESLITDIRSLGTEIDIYKFDMKRKINAIVKDTEEFRKEFNIAFQGMDKAKIEFGNITDELKEIIFNHLKM